MQNYNWAYKVETKYSNWLTISKYKNKQFDQLYSEDKGKSIRKNLN